MKKQLLLQLFHTLHILLFLSFCGSCKQTVEKQTKKSFLRSFECPIIGRKDLKINEIVISRIDLEVVHSSLIGSVYFREDRQFFVDFRFGWVFEYDLNGKLLSRKVGSGRGPMELPATVIDAFQFDRSGNAYFIGPSLDVYLFDSNWERKKSYLIEKSYLRDTPLRYDDINPSNEGLYSIEYMKFIVRFGPNCFYIPICGSWPEEVYSPYSSIDHYLQCYILAKIDSKSGKILELQGQRTPELLNYNFLSQFRYFSYDVDLKDNMYFSHEIDSLIYVYDNKFKLINKFGFAGQDMRCNYQDYAGSFNKVKLTEDRSKFSFYDWLEYIDQTDLLFRSYRKNLSLKYDGLQIYRNGDLIGDVNVPKGLQVRHYKEQFYYSNVFIDEEANTMWVYKFTLPQ